MQANELNWKELGTDLRRAANDGHDEEVPDAVDAYDFLLENPDSFGYDEWPADMPDEAPAELIEAYNVAGSEGTLLSLAK